MAGSMTAGGTAGGTTSAAESATGGPAAGGSARRVEGAARRARHSPWMDRAARLGLVAYAVVYLLVGWLSVQLAFGDHHGRPSSNGAMHELARQPFGEVLVWLVSIGMFLLVAWKGLEALLGHADEDGGKRLRKRLAAALKAVLYAAVGIAGLGVALGSRGSGGGGRSGGSGGSSDTWTAKLLDLPGGQVLVFLVGLAVVGYGAYQVYLGWSEKFAKKLDAEGRSGSTGTAYLAFGKAGYTAKGLVVGLVGVLCCYAAVTQDPHKSGGVDDALFRVLSEPFGPVLLGAIGLGLVCYGLFTLARARHLRS